ncbi:unnamed protein product [Adineta ricciae]|uniref:Uncharacterized protein n=1 Tax=Adineta ricciae TaxID=249248 RepID=A0A815QHP6_ADIRI|nr:unnamed protein product [Adineta ricciae]
MIIYFKLLPKSKMVNSERGRVRSFAASKTDLERIILRSNARHDSLVNLRTLHQQQINNSVNQSREQKKELARKHILAEKGILGPCIFRSLFVFDVGSSFMTDSLHNIYSGAFKRMLKLWFDPKYSFEPWSIKCHMNSLSAQFAQLRLPSTTTRLPRHLNEFKTFKANEMRILLLFGFAIFAKVLRPTYYNHLLQLVALMHVVESRTILKMHLSMIQQLSLSFVAEFRDLYTSRHCVQVVHSVFHVSSTVEDFGPLPNFTTFNFESILGKITRATKSTRHHSAEIISGVHLYQGALTHLNKSSINNCLAQFLSSHLGYAGQSFHRDVQVMHETGKQYTLPSILFPSSTIRYFDVIYVRTFRITTTQYAAKKKADDSNIIFRLNNIHTFGNVCSIFSVQNRPPLLLVKYLSKTEPLFCKIISTNADFYLQSVRYGVDSTSRTCVIEAADFIEKCASFRSSDSTCYYFRFPTLTHSS